MPRDHQPDWLPDARRTLGDRIRAARLHANLTQEAVYLATGIPRTTYQAIERGTTDARTGDLLLIAQALGTTAADLLHGVGPAADTGAAGGGA